jgi:hypothetical protein
VKQPSSQAKMTASTTPTTAASAMALGFAERSSFDLAVSVVSDLIAVFLFAVFLFAAPEHAPRRCPRHRVPMWFVPAR